MSHWLHTERVCFKETFTAKQQPAVIQQLVQSRALIKLRLRGWRAEIEGNWDTEGELLWALQRKNSQHAS